MAPPQHRRPPSERTALLSSGDRAGSSEDAPQETPDFLKWRRIVLTLLVVAYTGYYFGKTNLPLAIPSLEDKEGGLKRSDVSIVLTSGYVLYLGGKFLSGFCVDKFGGKWTLLAGLLGSIGTSLLFPLINHVAWYAGVRAINQLFSSVGWGACVKITRHWYTPTAAAHAVAIASLAETLGDALVRLVLGGAMIGGLGWKAMFYLSAGVGAALFVPSLFVPGMPGDKGLNDPVETDEAAEEDMRSRSVFHDVDDDEDAGLMPMVKSVRIWLLSAELLVVILIRESFATFASSLIASELGLSNSYASAASAIFPALGAISSVCGGFLLDHTRQDRRGLIPVVSLGLTTLALVGMWTVTPDGAGLESVSSAAVATLRSDPKPTEIALFIGMIGAVALFLYAPKVIIDGAFVMDLAGGEAKVGTVTAFVTGVGYLGGCISPTVTGVMADIYGWKVAMLLLTVLCAAVTGASVLYWYLDLKALKANANNDGGDDGA
ncbi:hypothetical protein HDU87_005557 [Geranomyces variabilis]|uniref:Major facilitator superfamily (MFS) profile domain-containing protein n=1 Tax=Geranomyces variabilis TaxID=109894 RepID=A0AAD5TJ08_9FUNG|nr:hypothetical protein HDU87_005557 [Geranomyces variabilis]